MAHAMEPRRDLEQQITEGLADLRGLLGKCSTYSVAGWCLAYYLLTADDGDSTERLASPAKQVPFLLGVLLSSVEPSDPDNFGEVEWNQVKSVLDGLFSAYMLLYMPAEEDLRSLTPEWHRVREVSMLAFLHYFNTGLLGSVQQLVDRVKIYLAPFDSKLSATLGINASQALSICQWIADKLQSSLDELQMSADAEREHRLQLLEKATAENWSVDALKEAARNAAYAEKANKLLSGLQALGLVSLADLEIAFPDTAGAFWKQFSIGRGEGPEIRYPTERSVFETRPLIRVDDTRAFCPVVNGLFSALLLCGEEALLKSSVRDKFLRLRDKALEDEASTKIRAFLSREATIWTKAFETQDLQYEHDVIVIDDGLYLILEAKATPPVEPFRDPEKAFARLRGAFRSDTGIQKAYEQANRIVRRLKAGEVVPLYDERGRELGRLLPDVSKLAVGICVTRGNYGPLATDLALLLEKDETESYPWVVNIFDLSNLAEAWSYFGWGPKEFRNFLEQRITLHGKVFSDDELDFAGYFMRHGNFDSAIKTDADLLQLSPEYSSIFDDTYRHLHLGGPPVNLEQTAPVHMDLKRSLISGEPAFIDPETTASREGEST